MALNVQHVPVQRGFKLEDGGTPPPPFTNYPITEKQTSFYDDNSNGEGHR